jgi:hypothetical protein
VGLTAVNESFLAHTDPVEPPYADKSFDLTVLHALFHLCHSLHRDLLGRRLVSEAAIFESRDRLSMMLVGWACLGNGHRSIVVATNNECSGGVRNTAGHIRNTSSGLRMPLVLRVRQATSCYGVRTSDD